jgi:lipopolysaccharide transport system ATP-binding protein
MPLKTVECDELVVFELTFPANLGVGTYSFTLALHNSGLQSALNYTWKDRATFLNIVNSNHPEFMGIAWLPPTLKSQQGLCQL